MFAQRSLSGATRRLAAGLLVAFAIPALAAAQAAPSAHAAKERICNNPKPRSPYDKPPVAFFVTGVSCADAHALAWKVIAKAPKGCLVHDDPTHVRLSRPCRISGYRCTYRTRIKGLALSATCKRGHTKVVRFQAQA